MQTVIVAFNTAYFKFIVIILAKKSHKGHGNHNESIELSEPSF